jgi:starch phosphorylase
MMKRKNADATGDVGSDALKELALDLRWSWYHGSDELWSHLDPELWALTHNPWLVLQTASPTRVGALVARPAFRKRIERLLAQRREYLDSAAWFQQHHAQTPLSRVAYFSMEFALSEALPIYSGGLGNVAGDQLKAASDLAVPVVGVGLLYQQGYFRQMIAADGSQEELYPYNEPAQLPITPVRGPGGEWLRLSIQLPGYTIWLRAWQVQVGRVVLYLLDSNDPANPPAVRGIASELYGGGPELRLRQELLLGIGGWRLLRALGLEPEVCHLNEGHAAFAVLERARTFMEESGQPFDVALAVTRAGTLFTTHTAVAAGFDRFPSSLVERYLGRYAQKRLGIEPGRLLALGRERPDDPDEPFNMAYLAIRGSAAVNGVSRLHGAVSRRLLQSLFPRWPEIEVPVAHVTNGVHTPTWDSAEADALWTRTCGGERWRGTMETIEQGVACASDEELWAMRADGRKALVAYVRERMTSHVEFWIPRRTRPRPSARAWTPTRSRWDLPAASPPTSAPTCSSTTRTDCSGFSRTANAPCIW